MAPARTVLVPDRGEFFLRDTGDTDPTRPVVLLLHGWMVSADLNWHSVYGPLADAGYRVLAIDHRGHARGLRALAPFRLSDCADDAAAVLRTLEIDQAIAVGYSMGGTIAQLMARDHRELLSGLVLSGTCQHFQDPETVKLWRWMGAVGLGVNLAPRTFFQAGFKRSGTSSANWRLPSGRRCSRSRWTTWSSPAAKPSTTRRCCRRLRQWPPPRASPLSRIRPAIRYALRTMRRARITLALATVAVALLTIPSAAFARADGGQGWWGESNDKDVTNVMFITIAFFPLLITVLSLIQWRLDKRKHAREDALKARAANADWRGGW